jgi:spore coat polysaccharide biosynthesis protein SpsF
MKRVVIVQARMTSSRLPGKVLADLGGRPMLARQLERMRTAELIDELVVATTTNSCDDAIVALADRAGARWFRGSEVDVLSRYRDAAREAHADVVVRVTADCPLLDAGVLDRVVARICDSKDPCDYASNTIERTYPRGLDTEALHRDVLERIARLATSAAAREHVTYYLHRERPDLFLIRHVRHATDHSDLRWTVDTEEDLALVRAIHEEIDRRPGRPSLEELIELVRARPAWTRLNAHIEQRRT